MKCRFKACENSRPIWLTKQFCYVSPRRTMLFIKKNCLLVGQAAGRRTPLFFLATLSGLMLSQPVFAANITVASPVNGTTVPSPVWVRAHNVGCDGLAPTAFGYSVDSSSTLTK